MLCNCPLLPFVRQWPPTTDTEINLTLYTLLSFLSSVAPRDESFAFGWQKKTLENYQHRIRWWPIAGLSNQHWQTAGHKGHQNSTSHSLCTGKLVHSFTRSDGASTLVGNVILISTSPCVWCWKQMDELASVTHKQCRCTISLNMDLLAWMLHFLHLALK